METSRGPGRPDAMEDDLVVAGDSGPCARCGLAVRDAVIRCHRCSAPYHPACRDGTVDCVVYGCDVLPETGLAASSPAGLPPESAASGPGPTALAPFESRLRWLGLRHGFQLGLKVTGVQAILGTILAGLPVATQIGRMALPDVLGLLGGWMMMTVFWLSCGALLGAVTGASIPGRSHRARILFFGTLGPGLAASALLAPFWLAILTVGGSLIEAVQTLPLVILFIMMYSIPLIPFALPCALLVARQNERNREASSGRAPRITGGGGPGPPAGYNRRFISS